MKFLLVVALLIGGAWFYLKPLPPGQGPVAASAMRSASGVVNAIEAFKSNRGMYPGTMEEMVPDFMGGMPRLKNGATLEYMRLSGSYKLTFNYTNPLPAHCTHEPNTSKMWTCEWL